MRVSFIFATIYKCILSAKPLTVRQLSYMHNSHLDKAKQTKSEEFARALNRIYQILELDPIKHKFFHDIDPSTIDQQQQHPPINFKSKFQLIENFHYVDSIIEVAPSVTCILISEYNAIVHQLVHHSLHEDIANGKTIVLESRGVLDILTRLFLHKLAIVRPDLVFLTITDADVLGFVIRPVFKHGSHKWGYLNDFLAVPRISYFGVRMHQIGIKANDAL